MKKAWALSYPLSAQRRRLSDWVDAKADLSLRWAHMPFCWFCHEAAHVTGTQQTVVSSPNQPLTTVLNTAQSTTTQTLLPTDACTIAKSNCVSACGAGGYLTDPTDCTVCVCKSTVLG